MRYVVPVVALVFLQCAREPADSQRGSVSPTLVVRADRVLDGERLLRERVITVAGDRILALGEASTQPSETPVVQCTDCTLIPGLIDAHTHIAHVRQLQQALAFGVTTELDLYTFLPLDLRSTLRRELAAGERSDLADFRMATTPVTCPEGLGVRFNPEIPTLGGPDEAQAFVDARLAEGADYIKVMYEDGYVWGGQVPNLSLEELTAAIDAAHARSKLAVTHVTSRHGARAAVDAGADGFAHAFFDEPPDAALARDAAARPMFFIGTLTTLQGWHEGPSGAELAGDDRFRPYLHASALESLVRESPLAGRAVGTFENALEAVRRFAEAGVVILAGTDAPNPGTAHGLSVHRELELLVRAGLTPSEALAAATSRPAHQFGLNDRGRIEVDKRADLLLVRGDPTSDILATRDIVAVIRSGVVVDRESLAEAIQASPN